MHLLGGHCTGLPVVGQNQTGDSTIEKTSQRLTTQLDANANQSQKISISPHHKTDNHRIKVAEGKRAWSNNGGTLSGATNNGESTNPTTTTIMNRREESNEIFRTHRLSELQSVADTLSQISVSAAQRMTTTNTLSVATPTKLSKFMFLRFLYFGEKLPVDSSTSGYESLFHVPQK
jgi:hypothetical protein